MKHRKIRTNSAMQHGTFRVKRADRAGWIEAAIKVDESMSEFLRVALRERIQKVLAVDELHAA
jgi:hypothetical protein